MLALCVDDEPLLLQALVRAVESSADITEVVSFTLCSKALEWAQEHRPDVAFLDISMRGIGGIELAKKLQEQYPDIAIVFCTGYSEYALDAIRLHASGYVMKPVNPEDIQREIDYIKTKNGVTDRLTVQCFGNFEVFYHGDVVRFKRRRSKELLAYLIDRRGASVTAKEICTALWDDDEDLQKNIMYFYKLFADLRDSLTEIGLEDVLVKGSQDYAVNAEKIDCDYYRFLAGDETAKREFNGEYMMQYSWAEETAALLYRGNM